MSVPYDETVMTSTMVSRAGGSRKPILSAALGAACISSSAVLVELARADAVTSAFFRCALALPVLVPLDMLEQRKLGRRPIRSRVSAWVAGLFLAVDLVLWNHAIADVGAGVATVLGNLQILFVAALAWLVLHERPHRRLLVMLPVVLAGVVLVSGMLGSHRAAGLHPAAGVGFGLATSAAYACYLLILRKAAGQGQHVAGQLADATAGAAIGTLAIGAALGGLQFDVPWSGLRWLIALALLSQTAGWLLITASLPRLPAAVSSLVLLLQPAASLLLADIVLGERPTIVQIAGAVLVCVGVLASTRTSVGRAAGENDAPGQDIRSPVAVTAKST
jgi:drug/metabolite transporter (DMT)-like permease